MTSRPAVSAIIATYNRSGVLRHAIESVLAQTVPDFELLVVGDACTDDSEAVVRSFGDPRVRWDNLAANAGNQWAPNNRGLALARAPFIAYLGHDDLWHPRHLEVLLSAIERTPAELVFSVAAIVGPPPENRRALWGRCPHGAYEWRMVVPPGAWLHRRDLVDHIGPWRDHRSLVVPPDFDFINRAFEGGCRLVPVDEITLIKFPSIYWRNAYVEAGSDLQREYRRRLATDPELCRRLAQEASSDARQADPVLKYHLVSRTGRGEPIRTFRLQRGLAADPPDVSEGDALPLHADGAVLRMLNYGADIGPARDRRRLHDERALPEDGLFVGLGWHEPETDAEGAVWRWAERAVEIVVTRPTGRRRRLAVDVAPGYGVDMAPFRLDLLDAARRPLGAVRVSRRRIVTFELPLARDAGAVFALDAPEGGRTLPTDSRILNFRVFGFRWANGDRYPRPWRGLLRRRPARA